MSDQQPTILRCSQLAGWTDCERRSSARSFWREIERAGYRLRRTARSIGALIGTATHKSASVVFDEKAALGTLPPVSVATDCASQTLREQLLDSGEVLYDGTRGVTHSMKEAQQQVVTMAASYHRTVAPVVHPLVTEKRFEAAINAEMILTGTPDLVAIEPNQIRDLKTGVRSPNAAAQVGGYSLLVQANGLGQIETAAIDFVQRVRTNRPQPDPVTTPVQLDHAEVAAIAIIRRIALGISTFRNGDAERGIRPGDAWSFTANPQSVLCSPKYCPAFGTEFCHEGKKDD